MFSVGDTITDSSVKSDQTDTGQWHCCLVIIIDKCVHGVFLKLSRFIYLQCFDTVGWASGIASGL